MKTLLIRMTDEEKEKLAKASKADGRSMNSFIIQATKEKMAKSEKGMK